MLTILKGYTGNTITATLYEKLSYYGLTGQTNDTYHFKFINDLNNSESTLALVDLSNNPWRYNKFIVDETQLNLVPGLYSYSAATTSGFTQILETGRLTVSGINTNSSIYW